jgi:hypothetical protein
VAFAIPLELLDPERKDDFLLWVAGLPIHPEDRKQLCLEWSAWTGVLLTHDDYVQAGAD